MRKLMAVGVAAAMCGLVVAALRSGPGLVAAAAGSPNAPAGDVSPCSSVDSAGIPLSAREILTPAIRLCDTSAVSMTVKASCGAIPLHVMLNLDYSGSMVGQPWQDAKEAALALIRELDLGNNPETEIGLTYHGIQAKTIRLSNNPGGVIGQINRIQPGGEDNLPQAIDKAAAEIVRSRPRGGTGSFDAMVILSDGGQTFPPSQAVAAAGRAKARKILIVAVCLENGASSCPQMRQMASGSQYYFEARGTAGLSRIFREIAGDLRDINLRQMAISETLPDGVHYIEGSGAPEPDVEGQTLSWEFRFLPKSGVSIRYGITATDVTTYTLAESEISFRDSEDRLGEVIVPTRVLTVTGPCLVPVTPTATPSPSPTPTRPGPTNTPTPTPTNTPTPTPVPGRLYLPILGFGRCIERDRPVDVALAIDASSSMTGQTAAGRTKLEAAVEAARSFTALMSAEEHVAVISFNDAVTVQAELTNDSAILNSALDAIAWSPYTRIDLALAAATDELLGPRGRPDANRVIVLLTDGQPTHTTPQAVRDEAGLARSAGITIFTVGLGPDVDATLLADVAGDTDRYFPAPDGEDLEHIYAMIREKIPCK